MAITAQTPYTNHMGNGTTTIFAYTFTIFDESDMAVYVDGILQTLTTDYSISNVGSGSGGNVTFVSAPTSGKVVRFVREMPYDREVDYQTSGDLLADTLDNDLDRLECQIQQLGYAIDRAMSYPNSDASSVTGVLPSATDRAEKVLYFDSTGKPTAVSISVFNNIIAGANYVVDAFTGDGVTKNFVLSIAPGTRSNTDVHIDGVYQNKEGYALNDTVLTFSEAPYSGADIEVVSGDAIPEGFEGNATAVRYVPSGTGAVETNVAAKLSETVSVSDFDPDPTGILDSSTEFTSAVNAAQVSGVTVTVPNGTYKILDAGGFPSQNNAITPVNILAGADVQFTGTVVGGDDDSVPCFGHSKTNWYNLMNYNYMYSEPGYAWEDPNIPGQYPFGSMTLIVECIPQTTFQGNADACFFGFRGKAGGNFAGGAVNFLSELESGFLGNANVSEFDINNFAADGKGLGITIIGVGTHKPEVAQKIARVQYGNQSPTGVGGDWIPPYQYGIQIYNAENGLYIDQQQVESPQAAIGINPGPQATPTDYSIFINDPNSDRKFGVQNNGYIKPRDEAPFSVFGTNVVAQATSGQNPSMYLMPDGWVRLAGQILASVGTTVSPGSTLITLDANFRPNRTVYLPIVNSAGTLGSVTITSSGVITSSITLTDATYLALDAVSFKLSN